MRSFWFDSSKAGGSETVQQLFRPYHTIPIPIPTSIPIPIPCHTSVGIPFQHVPFEQTNNLQIWIWWHRRLRMLMPTWAVPCWLAAVVLVEGITWEHQFASQKLRRQYWFTVLCWHGVPGEQTLILLIYHRRFVTQLCSFNTCLNYAPFYAVRFQEHTFAVTTRISRVNVTDST